MRQVVFIMTDTTRYDMVGCYGNRDMITPNMDSLAEKGVRYERAYTCQPVCGPARSSIFTGTFPHSNGSWSNCLPLGDNVKTIGQRLRDNDIATGYIGKWHLDGGDYFGLGRCPDGWDEAYWYDMRCYLEELSYEERIKSRKPETMDNESIEPEFTYAHRVTNRSLDYIEKHKNEDFFLAVSYDEPHHPFLCPEPYASMYKDYQFPIYPNVYDTLENKPEHQKIWAQHQHPDELVAYLLGCNSFVDSEIGRILEKIEREIPDALIIFTSDHGDFLNSHKLFAKGPSVYDEIARIPFIIAGGGVEGGRVYESPVSHINIVPTVMDYMGLPIPKILEGKSLLPSFTSDERVNDYVFVEFGRYEVDHDSFGGFQPFRGIFDGRFKLVINLLSGDELYDMQNDPYEMDNLIENETFKSDRNRLHDALLKFMNDTRDPFRGYYWENRPWRTEAQKPSWNYTNYTRQRENEEYEPKQLDYLTGLEMEAPVRYKG